MELKLTYGDEVLFKKDVELDARKKQRLVDRTTTLTRTVAEKIAYGKARRDAWWATLTKEQKAEVERVVALTPEKRQKEFLEKEKAMLEYRLAKIKAQLPNAGA